MALAAKQNGQHPMDDVADTVARAVGGVEQIKGERDRFRDHAAKSDNMVAIRDGEIAAQNREIISLRYRLSYYQNFSTTLASHFNSILAHVEEALKASMEAGQYAANDQRERGVDVPEFELPSFIQRWQSENQERQA